VLLTHVVRLRILSSAGPASLDVSRVPLAGLLLLVMATSTKPPSGMLPIPASATKKPVMTARPPKTQGRAGLPKLRLIVRRLPPGLTEEEFQTALGDEWKVGAGKVDWAAYKVGKISKE
jgi:regulator of nonsense transcripts 3